MKHKRTGLLLVSAAVIILAIAITVPCLNRSNAAHIIHAPAASCVIDRNKNMLVGMSLEEAVAEYVSGAHIPTAIPEGYTLERIDRLRGYGG